MYYFPLIFTWILMPMEKAFGHFLVIVSFFITDTEGWNSGFQWEIPMNMELASRLGRPTDEPRGTFLGVTLVTQCAFHCLQNTDTCQSFSYQQQDSLCLLYNITLTSTTTKESDDTYKTYDIAHWTLDQVSTIYYWPYENKTGQQSQKCHYIW